MEPKDEFKCNKCGISFTRIDNLQRHIKQHAAAIQYKCDQCAKTFTRKDNLQKHLQRHEKQYNCNVCGKVFYRYDAYQQHNHNQLGGAQGGARKRPLEDLRTRPPNKKLKENVKENYTITKTNETFMDKFQARSTSYKVRLHDVEVRDIAYILESFDRIFTSLLEEITTNAGENDLIRLSIQTPQLDYPIQLPFIKKKDLTVSHILDEIERVLQSDEEFTLDDGIEIDIIQVHNPNGGRLKQGYVNLERFLKEKQCIIRIQNKDDLCCARAIVTAKARLDKHEKWEQHKKRIRAANPVDKDIAPRSGCSNDQMRIVGSETVSSEPTRPSDTCSIKRAFQCYYICWSRKRQKNLFILS